jgi:purine-binding chemotaxis protein CheW
MMKEMRVGSLPSDRDDFDFLIFKLNDELYGIELEKNLEVIRYDMNLIRIPGEPKRIKGVINLRNNIIPVVDLKKRLVIRETQNNEIQAATSNGHPMILVAKVNHEPIGFIIDEVMEFHKVSRSQIEVMENRDLLKEGIS